MVVADEADGDGLGKLRASGLPIARRLYPRVRPLYHPVTSGSVDELKLGI